MESQSELQSNLETYQAQLKQVEAALMIDEDNDELVKLKGDLEEVINLTLDLLSMSNKKKESKSQQTKRAFQEKELHESDEEENKVLERPEQPSTAGIQQDIFEEPEPSTATGEESLKRTSDDADIDFEAMFNLPKRAAVTDASAAESPQGDDVSTKPKDKNRLSREDQEKRREQRKKKLLKKQQRFKEIEEQREREKSNWQQFVKGPTKGKGKLKGLIKKSIFASPEASTGKVGIGTCGIGGKGMTSYENPTQYIYKK
ncbi:survival of motor neuron-related-splicing factor 30-like [Rhopilema esculentum]|uniref:survival of motor neuron-related-splicing factor 30-like n=1 Tax=Rhopilema esculentum TaxID=499914 RepID=UPI0031D839D0|eukprot:gene8230-14167_t